MIQGRTASHKDIRPAYDANHFLNSTIDEDLHVSTSMSPNSHLLIDQRSPSFEHFNASEGEPAGDAISVREMAKISFNFSVLWVYPQATSSGTEQANSRDSLRYV